MEDWKKVMGFERYSVSNLGNVRNDERGTTVKPMLSTSGYLYVHLVKDKKKHTKYVHRLVGTAFLPNPNALAQIDHIDGNKINDIVTNLRWVTVSQNCLAYGSKSRSENRKRRVKATYIDGQEIIFNSRVDIAKYFQCSPSKIKYNYLYKKGNKNGWIFNLID